MDSIRKQVMFHTFEHFLLLAQTRSSFWGQMAILSNTLCKVEHWCDTLGSLLGLAVAGGRFGFYTETGNVSHF